MPEKKLAKKSAAQKACIRLYEVGELNDHFLPIERSDDSDSDDDDDDDDEDNQGSAQGKEGSKKAKDIYPRKVCISRLCIFPKNLGSQRKSGFKFERHIF